MGSEKQAAHPPSHHIERRLAAILSADVKGYSRLMGEDEEATLRTLTAHRHVMDALIAQHRGRIVGTAGDSVLAEFASVVDAVQCAVVIQTSLKTENTNLPPERKMEFRMGINLGDVMVDGEQIYGDGVNIAARLEALAEAGGICISGVVHDQVKNKLALTYEDLGAQAVKNIAEPVRVWRAVMDEAAAVLAEQVALRQAQHERLEERPSVGAGLALLKPKGAWPMEQPGRSNAPTWYRQRGALAVGGLLVVGALVTLLYPSLQTIHNPQSAIRNQEAQPPSLPLPGKPSLVVLPFVNMSEDPKQEYFSDGITEDLTADLSKISSLFVIARNSAFTYKGKAVKVQDVSKELGVRYVLEGSVRKAGDQVRVTAQLVDAITGGHLWSERYDRELKDIFALQDEIRQKIVLALKVKLTPEEQERFRQVPTDNLEAYEFVLGGRESFLRITKEATAQARQMYEKAIELDPQYAGAYAALAQTHFADWGLWFQGPQSLEQAFVLAQKAVALDDSLAYAHTILGSIYLRKKQPDQAIAEAEKAVSLDPNSAYGYAEWAEMLTWVGRPEETIALVDKAMRLDPQNAAYYAYPLGHAHRLLRQYEEATTAFKRCLSHNPNHVGCHTHLAATYSELGQEEEAQAEAAEMLRLNPIFSLERFRQNLPYTDQAASERFIAALRQAGLK